MLRCNRILSLCLVGVCLLLLAAAPGQAQTRGTVSGYVTDATGAALANARVTITLQQTGAQRETVANEAGFYQFVGLGPGDYTIQAEAPNFKQFTSSAFPLRVDENVRSDVRMEVGSVTERVEVTAEVPVVDTRSSTLASVVDDRRITDLPLLNRNIIAFAQLLPGVTQVSAPSNTDVTDARQGPTITVNGGRNNQSYETLNGTYFNNPSRNTGLNAPPPDAIQEFRMQTSNYSAESGRNAGAIVSVVTRSGTNSFHGSAWEFHRNSALNARNFFQDEKPKERQNQFGVAAGGPIMPDKIFIFGAYEGLRDRRAASTVNAFPPTAAELAGDFSGVSTQLINPFTNEPFPNNQIPTNSFDPVSANLLNSIPVAPAGGRLTAIGAAPRSSELGMIRNDWTLTSRQTLYGHYYINQNNVSTTGLAYGTNIEGWMDRLQDVRNQNAGINHTFVISPTLLNQLTLGYTRSVSFDRPSTTRTNASLGIVGMPDYTDGGSVQFSIPGRFALRSGGPVLFKSNNYDLNEGLSWTKGRHSMRFGFQYLDLRFFQSFLGPPTFTFNGTRSGDPMADFLLGAYRNVGVGFGVRVNDGRSYFAAGYAQDDFKVNRHLTLNYGLRYELPGPWVDRGDRINTLDLRPGVQSGVVPNAPPNMLFVGDLPRGLYPTDKNNFAPRFGFAYDPAGDGKTAIRGAWGLFYDTMNTDTIAQENPPFAGSTTFFNGRLQTPLVGHTPPPVVPNAANFEFVYPINLFFTDLGLRTPYIQQWNFTIERQVGRDISIQAAYVGKLSQKLQAFRPWNVAVFQPGVNENGEPLSTLENAGERAPFLPGIYGTESIVLSSTFTQHYEGGQFRVEKRFSNNFSVLGAYTLGKSIDSSSTNNLGGCISNPYDLNSEKGRADFDARHTGVVSWLWTPVEARGGVLRRIFGGWNLSGIHRVRSGYPLTFYNGDDVALGGDICGGGEQHPNLLRNPARDHGSREDMITEFFDTEAFGLPDVGTYGSAGRNILSGPGFSNSDFAILKDFGLTEAARLQFRAEFFNAFNQVNFTSVDNVLLSDQFGQILGAGAGRQIQFGLKVIW